MRFGSVVIQVHRAYGSIDWCRVFDTISLPEIHKYSTCGLNGHANDTLIPDPSPNFGLS